MDDSKKLERVLDELTAIYEDFDVLVEQQILTRKFLKILLDETQETNILHLKNKKKKK